MHGCDFVYKFSTLAVKIHSSLALCRVASPGACVVIVCLLSLEKQSRCMFSRYRWTLGKSMIFKNNCFECDPTHTGIWPPWVVDNCSHHSYLSSTCVRWSRIIIIIIIQIQHIVPWHSFPYLADCEHATDWAGLLLCVVWLRLSELLSACLELYAHQFKLLVARYMCRSQACMAIILLVCMYL